MEANSYSPDWFSHFLETVPAEWTATAAAGVMRRLPLPAFRRVLDVCCGFGRHARELVANGYDVVGVDRDPDAVARAAREVPAAQFVVLDQRDVADLAGTFDAALILWQSFGYFDAATNDAVLRGLHARLRPGGRLLLDLFHPDHVGARQGRRDAPRSGVRSITDSVANGRLTSLIVYEDGRRDVMDFELFTPEGLVARAGDVGFRLLETCCWWDESRPPDPDVARYQAVFERA